MDLGDIRRIVQYMIPQRLTQWTQHAGRCGRDGKPALAILLVEPSVFQKVRTKKLTNNTRNVKRKDESQAEEERKTVKAEPTGDVAAIPQDNEVFIRLFVYTLITYISNIASY